MKRATAILLLLLALLLALRRNAELRHETHRLRSNAEVLSRRVDTLRRLHGLSVAETGVLRLRAEEFERRCSSQARLIRDLGVRLREAQHVSRSDMVTAVEFTAPADSTPATGGVRFAWSDTWTRVEGEVEADSVRCRVESCDTLLQVLHRVPRRFLFIRWGTKAVRQQTISTNPHTRVVYSEYIELERH